MPARPVDAWLSELAEGNTERAWDVFLERYRRLMIATIERLVPDRDDVMDVFSSACQALAENDLARLRRYSAHGTRTASVATWLVAVVRNLTIDWLRREEGRKRVTIPGNLSPLQRDIYRAVCLDGASYVEAYEMIHAHTDSELSFGEFLREVRATHNAVPWFHHHKARRSERGPVREEPVAPTLDSVETADLARRIARALSEHPQDVRLAVELFIVDRLSAAEVARAVGWPNEKSVYNRVYRALTALRSALEREGIGPGDL